MTRRLSIALIAIFALACVPTALTLAQDATGSLPQLGLSVSPQNPAPGDTVTLKLTSYDIDVNSSDIDWKVDGKTVQDAVGDATYTLTANASGKPSTITVIATPLTGSPETTSVTITPTTVDLLWQATNSTVPPLYRGKAMPTSESTIRYVAMPELKASNGAVMAANTLVYNWQQNYTPDQDDSGYGKTSFTVISSPLDNGEHIDVSMESRDGSVSSAASADVTAVQPKILWYVDDPTYGPRFQSAIAGDYTVSTASLALFAEPYYFAPGTPVSPNLTYSWNLNGNSIDTPVTPNVLVLQRDGTNTGTATVDLSLSNATTLFQEAESAITLHLQ